MNERLFRSVGRRLATLTVILAGFSSGCSTNLSPSPSPAAPPESAVTTLDNVFVKEYLAAAQTRLADIKASGPVILNDFLNMTLYRPGAEPERFNMTKDTYFLMARASHPPLALYSMLSPGGLGALSDTERTAVATYADKLRAARAELPTMAIDPLVRQRIDRIFELSERLAATALTTNAVSEAEYLKYAAEVRPLLKANLELGAREQLRQFRDQLNYWRAQFPAEHWDQLHVVVLGFHQARELYAPKLFFQWLLREPEVEDRVVYAEVLIPPFGEHRGESHDLALELLAKVSLDRDAARLVLGDESALGRDVMGPAARDIIEDWGSSQWPP